VISVAVTYLDQNPNVRCSGLKIGQIRVSLDDGQETRELARQTCAAPETAIPPLVVPLDPGDYTLEVVGIAAATEDTVATTVKTHDFTVEPDVGGLVDLELDFGANDFEPALESPLRFKIDYQATPDHVRGGCSPGPAEGTLCIEQLDVQVFGDGQELIVSLGSFGTTPVTDAECVEIPLQSDESFTWGVDADDFTVTAIARGRPDSDALTCPDPGLVDPLPDCFATEVPIRLAPGSDWVSVPLPRVLDDQGLPPQGCADCQVDDDCDLTCTDCCVDRVCHPP
jgi:hypothetical protein